MKRQNRGADASRRADTPDDRQAEPPAGRGTVIKNGTVLFPLTGCEQLVGQLFDLGVESHDDLVDGLIGLLQDLSEQGPELPKIHWIDGDRLHSKMLDLLELGKDIVLPVAGYFARAAQQLFGKKRMRRQLYRELAKNYHSLDLQIHNATSVKGIAAGAPFRFVQNTDLSFSIFAFYNAEGRRAALFDLEEAGVITRCYDKLNLIGVDSRSYAHVRAKEALAEVDDALREGRLNPKLFKKMSAGHQGLLVDDLLNGKRESYRKYLPPRL